MARLLYSRLLTFLCVLVLPTLAHARTLGIPLGTSLDVEGILTHIINYLAAAIVFVASAMFAVGAFMIVISRGEPDAINKGKNLIIGAVIGMTVVLGSFGILRTVFYFIYA